MCVKTSKGNASIGACTTVTTDVGQSLGMKNVNAINTQRSIAIETLRWRGGEWRGGEADRVSSSLIICRNFPCDVAARTAGGEVVGGAETL